MPLGVIIYLICIGMRVMCKAFPVGMTTGQVPISCLPSPPLSARKQAHNSGALQSTNPVPFQHKVDFTYEGNRWKYKHQLNNLLID